MPRKTYLLSLSVFVGFIMVITGSIVFAHSPGSGSPGGNFRGNGGYAMMGGQGMTGSQGMMGGGGMMGGRGMIGWFRSLLNRFTGRQEPDTWNGPEQNIRDFDYQNSNSRAEIEALRNQINTKRKQLGALYRPKDTDKAIIDKWINELSDLERRMDERLSVYKYKKREF